MSCRYTLYKKPCQYETLAIIQYLYHNDIFVLPTVIVEHNHPKHIELPSIYDHRANILYQGIEECLLFFEAKTNMTNLYNESIQFKENNPSFQIH